MCYQEVACARTGAFILFFNSSFMGALLRGQAICACCLLHSCGMLVQFVFELMVKPFVFGKRQSLVICACCMAHSCGISYALVQVTRLGEARARDGISDGLLE